MPRIRFSNSAETDLPELWLNIANEAQRLPRKPLEVYLL